jgi:hypothetical protein
MAGGIDFRAPGDRELLWTTGENTGFSRVHCEVPKQPNLKFLGHESCSDFGRFKKIYMVFFGPAPTRDVYLGFRLPWPAKIATGM